MQRNRNRVTIKDIALQCNVTANTVSRALRDDRKISEATIQKIKKTALEMGYVRNNMASAMRSGSSHLISIIVDDLPNPHYSVLIDKIDDLLKKNGYDIMILCSHGKYPGHAEPSLQRPAPFPGSLSGGQALGSLGQTKITRSPPFSGFEWVITNRC